MAAIISNSKSTDGANRYTQGGITDEFDRRLGWWERTKLVRSADDIQYTVSSAEAQRADLIAFRLYQQAKLGWLVLQYNNIVDPATELLTGTVLTLPTPTRVALTITSI